MFKSPIARMTTFYALLISVSTFQWPETYSLEKSPHPMLLDAALSPQRDQSMAQSRTRNLQLSSYRRQITLGLIQQLPILFKLIDASTAIPFVVLATHA